MKLTKSQQLLRIHLREIGIETRPEYRFCLERRYRFDLFSEELKMGFEADGGQWSGGHMRGKALEQQYEKDRLAQLMGFRIMRFTNREILNGNARAWLSAWLEGK